MDGKYETREGRYYLGSFAGYFPADKPKYSCMVAVQTFVPFGVYRPYYGGTLAGPVFRKIADKVYSQAVDWGQEVEKPIVDRDERQKIARMSEEEKSLRSRVIAEEQRVLPKIAVKGGNEKSVSKVIGTLNLDKERVLLSGKRAADDKEAARQSDDVPEGIMPDVQGMGLRDALLLLEGRGLKVVATGKGSVRSQSVRKGTPITPGGTVYLTLSAH